MPLRSIDLPACRTLHFAHPPSVVHTHHDAHTVYTAPDCPESWNSHRLVLHHPPQPADLQRLSDTWRAHHAGKGIGKGWLVWESRETWPHEVPDGFELHTSRVLMNDQETVIDLPECIRPLGLADADLIDGLFATLEGDRPGARTSHRWYIDGLLQRIDDDWGTWLGAFDGDDLVGVCAVLYDSREARLQSVMVHPDHQRRGLASQLVNGCLQAYQEVSFGITYVAAEHDSPGEALYRKLEFRGVTWLYYAGFEP